VFQQKNFPRREEGEEGGWEERESERGGGGGGGGFCTYNYVTKTLYLSF